MGGGVGGVGVRGANVDIVNAGSINGGMDASANQANALEFTGGTNSLQLVGSHWSLGGNIQVDAGGSLAFTQTENQTLPNTISGDGQVIQNGAGTLTLTGANTYGGGTTVSQGILQIGNGGTTGSIVGDILNNANVTFNRSDNIAFSGVISGTGSLTKTGDGALTLSGANTFSGALAVDAGNLTLGATGSLANASSLSLGAGTIFDYSAASAYNTASPGLLKNLTVSGLGATIKPNPGSFADFTNGSLFFNIPNTAVANSVLLTVQGDANITGASVGLDTPSGRPNINPGDKVILMDVTGSLTSDLTTLTVKTASGDTYTIEVDGDQLEAILQSLSSTTPSYERLKAYAEARAANLALVNQGADFLLDKGFGSALAATAGPGLKIAPFGGLGGGWSRYDTGSHVDVSSLSLLSGLGLGNDTGPGRMTLGAFFEAGWGGYNSYNSFSNSASVGGKGDMDYYGGGVLGRYGLTQGFLSGLYVDASARMGGTRTDFRSDDIQYNGWRSNFESSAMYYGLHGGLGYIWQFTDKASLDMSAKVLWTRQQGDNLTVYQDHLRFADADSLRTRLGGRFVHAVNEYVIPYIGAYWEHEFDGETRPEVNGQSLSSPSLKGDTGMGELGLTLKPSKDLPLSFDLAAQGYVGEREGVTGSLQIRYEF